MKRNPSANVVVIFGMIILAVLVVYFVSHSPTALAIRGSVAPASESCGATSGTWTCNTPISYGPFSDYATCASTACAELGGTSSGNCEYYMNQNPNHPAAGDTPQEQCSKFCRTLSRPGNGDGGEGYICLPGVSITKNPLAE